MSGSMDVGSESRATEIGHVLRERGSAVPAALKQYSPRRLVTYALLLLIASAGLGYGLLHTKLFAVDRIDINGLQQLSRDEVLSQAKLHNGQFLIDLHSDAIAKRLESNPRVMNVDVESDWPHVLRLTVKERVPLAVAQTKDKKWAVIGDGGVVLAVKDLPQAGLPNALGVEAPATPGSQLDRSATDLVMVAGAMPESLLHRVVQMQEADNVLKLGLDSGTIVVLGDAQQLNEKLMAAAAVISNSDPKKIAQLDVRSPEMPLATLVGSGKTVPSTSTSTTNLPAQGTNSAVNKPSTTPTKPSTTQTTSSTHSTTKTGLSPGTSRTSSSTTSP